MTAALGLTRRSFSRDDNVSEQVRLQFVSQGKGQHISRLVFPAILEIQAMYLQVRHQREAEFRLPLAEMM